MISFFIGPAIMERLLRRSFSTTLQRIFENHTKVAIFNSWHEHNNIRNIRNSFPSLDSFYWSMDLDFYLDMGLKIPWIWIWTWIQYNQMDLDLDMDSKALWIWIWTWIQYNQMDLDLDMDFKRPWIWTWTWISFCPWIGLDFGFKIFHGFGFGLGFAFPNECKSKSKNPSPCKV